MGKRTNKQGEKAGILGYGEVGKAIARFYRQPYIKDLEFDRFPEKLDVLNVCTPPSKQFIKFVSELIIKHKPELVIIHSTVPAGTTKQLYKKFKNVVHSPIRGVHPFLFEGVKTFVKYVGADNQDLGERAAKHLKRIGIKKVKIFTPSETTELGKLLDTTYYGLCIAFHSYAEKICKKTGTDFEKVMKDFNESYNRGYLRLGKSNVVRPVLFAPKDGHIGGHCIMPNAEILKEQFGGDLILDSLLRHKNNK
ncbi:MAG: hypothetical protein M1383_02015 [Patescibacteria group bacterium]|nr:hypothetical protein [Patescibacteria group bacterium]